MNNQPKITYMGRPLPRQYAPRRTLKGEYAFASLRSWLHAKWLAFVRIVMWIFRLGIYGTIVCGVLLAAYAFGEYRQSSVLTYVAPINVVHADELPVLDRIAKAESHNSQFCTKELAANGWCKKYEIGQVLQHVNTDNTIDTGYYQINSVNGAECANHGWNITIEADNKACGKWLFANRGSEPWKSSKSSWNR